MPPKMPGKSTVQVAKVSTPTNKSSNSMLSIMAPTKVSAQVAQQLTNSGMVKVTEPLLIKTPQVTQEVKPIVNISAPTTIRPISQTKLEVVKLPEIKSPQQINIPKIVTPTKAPISPDSGKVIPPSKGLIEPKIPSIVIKKTMEDIRGRLGGTIKPPGKNTGPVVPDWPVDGTPIHLTGSVTLTPNSQGTVNVDALKNPTGQYMIIDEIKFRISGSNGVSYAIGCKLTLDNLNVTMGYIPVICIDRIFTDSVDNIITPYIASSDGITQLNVYGSNVVSEYRYRPRYGIILKPGQVLIPNFQHNGALNYSAAIQISYSGRIMPMGFKITKNYLPYLTSYVSKTFTLNGTAQSDSSSEQTLANIFNQDIYIDKFISRCLFFYIAQGTNYIRDSDGTFGPDVKIQISRSDGYEVVKYPTSFWGVFDRGSRCLDVPHKLNAGDFYNMNISIDTSVITVATGSFSVQTVMSGYREII